MSFQEILEQIPQLSRDEKKQLIRVLSDQVEESPSVEGATYEIWSPFEPDEGVAEVWSPQVTDPDAMVFLVDLEKVLLTEGIEAANKLLTREENPSDGD
jgi:hypothetical protein